MLALTLAAAAAPGKAHSKATHTAGSPPAAVSLPGRVQLQPEDSAEQQGGLPILKLTGSPPTSAWHPSRLPDTTPSPGTTGDSGPAHQDRNGLMSSAPTPDVGAGSPSAAPDHQGMPGTSGDATGGDPQLDDLIRKLGLRFPTGSSGTDSPGAPFTRQKSRPDPFADVVAVGDGVRFWCTGTLITPSVVLTAAHCLPATAVHFGSRAASGGAWLEVRATHPAPPALDAGLLVLDSDVPLPLHPLRKPGDGAPPAGLGMLVGFGATDSSGRNGAGIERAGEITLNGWGCDAARPRTTGCDPLHEMVIPAENGRDTCNGDSGGPVFERRGHTWRLLAITSRPVRSSRVACGEGGVYVRVDVLVPWILETIRNIQGAPKPWDH